SRGVAPSEPHGSADSCRIRSGGRFGFAELFRRRERLPALSLRRAALDCWRADSRGCDCTGFLANGAAESSSAAAFLARAFVVRHWNRRAHIARRGYSGRRAAALAVSRALVFVGFAQWSRSVDFGDARRRASPTCLISPCERGNRLQEKTSASIERRDGRAGYCRGLHWSAR